MRERRRYPRLPICTDVGVKQSSMPVVKAKGCDMSVGGIRLFSRERLPRGNLMELEMNLPVPTVIACGQVAWTKEVETKEGKFFQVGINFSRLEQGFDRIECSFPPRL